MPKMPILDTRPSMACPKRFRAKLCASRCEGKNCLVV
jgi:hypothetical protein